MLTFQPLSDSPVFRLLRSENALLVQSGNTRQFRRGTLWLPIITNIPANSSSLMASVCRVGDHSFFRPKLVILRWSDLIAEQHWRPLRHPPCIRTFFVRQSDIGEPPNPFQDVALKRAEIGRIITNIAPQEPEALTRGHSVVYTTT
jgi:hypothetical protein